MILMSTVLINAHSSEWIQFGEILLIEYSFKNARVRSYTQNCRKYLFYSPYTIKIDHIVVGFLLALDKDSNRS